ncbi:hypothetical protein [Dokdonella sp.]|uniref:hypothetical protein n=1 Tax=Dokdonella sp. TaxID=2291710 RepID=UPI0037845BAF
MSILPPPSDFHPQLSPDRLRLIASWLLEELLATVDDLTRWTDNSWTRGTTAFGRQRSRILAEWRSGKYPWLDVVDPGNALVFTIDGVPCRFSNDDPDNPSKDAVVGVNPRQTSFALFARPGEPVRHCFVVDRVVGDMAEPYVAVDGFSAAGERVCRWVSDSVRAFTSIAAEQPASVDVEKAKLGPKQPSDGSGEKPAAANDDLSEPQ